MLELSLAFLSEMLFHPNVDASGFSKDGLELICVILGGNYLENGDRATYTDAHTLYEYGYKNYELKSLKYYQALLNLI